MQPVYRVLRPFNAMLLKGVYCGAVCKFGSACGGVGRWEGRAGADYAHVRLWFRYAQARHSSVSTNQSSSSSMYDETGAHVYNRARHNSNPVGMAQEGAAGGRQPTPVHQGRARANTTANTTATRPGKALIETPHTRP